MTEAAKSYQETVAERSVLKKSAAHKKNGSAVSKLGNRRMSYQEICEKHGPCKTYSVEGLLSFEQFQDLPNDLKIEWITKTCDKYDIGIKHIGRYLFEQDDKKLSDYLGDCKILLLCSPGKRRAKSGLNQFKEDIVEWKRSEENAKIIDDNEKREQMRDFITYEQYKKLSIDEKISYINLLVEKYHVSAGTISTVLFEKSPDTLKAYLATVGKKIYGENLRERITKIDDRNPETLKENNDTFKKIVKEWKENKDMYTQPEETVIETIVEDKPEEVKDTFKVVSIEELDANSKNDAYKPVPLPYIEEKKSEPFSPFATPKFEYHDMHFSVSYIGNGIDIEELNSYAAIIGKTRVKVVFDVCTV